jgi:hypothetical protein
MKLKLRQEIEGDLETKKILGGCKNYDAFMA